MNKDNDINSPQSPTEKGTREATSEVIRDAALEGHSVTFDDDGNPVFEIDHAAESRLRLKIDLHVVPMVFLMYIWCFMDRASIGNARLAGLEEDLGMGGLDYNIALSVFFVTYTIIEIPSQLCCKIFGPGRWLPACTVGFGLITTLTIYCKNFGGLLAVRFFLGIAEGALLPGIAFYLSRWYRKNELVFRLALYIVAAPLAGAFGGLLAAAILTVDHIGWITEWRMIFFVEGIVTIFVGILAYLLMTASPETARWLNDDEKALAAFRIKSENIASTLVVDKLNSRAIKAGIINVNTLVIGLMFLFNNIMVQGLAVFLPTIVAALYPGSSVVQSQLRTVPPNVVGAFFTLASPFVAWRIGMRSPTIIFSGFFQLVGYAMFLGSTDGKVRYGASFLCTAGAFPLGAFCSGWASNNTSPDSARAVSIGTVVMMGNIGGLISAWGFTADMAPNYIPGNAVNLVGALVAIFGTSFLWAYQTWENNKRKKGGRDYRLDGKTPEEIALLGHKHPKFFYVS